jgi:hypothetical protein
MHTPLLVMPLLCGWSYAGYLGDPPGARPASAAERVAAAAALAPAPASPPACGCVEPRCLGPLKPDRTTAASASPAASRPAAPAEKPPGPGPGPAPRPRRWRLADVHGQSWEHDDPAVLSRWVAERNAALVGGPRVYRYGAAVSCPDGRCP